MKTIILAAGLGVAAFAFVPRSNAAPVVTCDDSLATSSRIDIAEPPPQESTEKSIGDLRRAAAGRNLAPVIGANQISTHYKVRINHTIHQIRPEQCCSTPKYINLEIALEKIIYIPREFAEDDCLTALARDYEHKKVAAQAPALASLRTRLLAALQTVIRRTSREASTTEWSALEEFTKETRLAVQRALTAIDIERLRLSAAVDTPEEVDRLRQACGGRAVGEY